MIGCLLSSIGVVVLGVALLLHVRNKSEHRPYQVTVNARGRDWPWFYFHTEPDGNEIGTVYRMCKACSRVDRGSLHGWEINDQDTHCDQCTPEVKL